VIGKSKNVELVNDYKSVIELLIDVKKSVQNEKIQER